MSFASCCWRGFGRCRIHMLAEGQATRDVSSNIGSVQWGRKESRRSGDRPGIRKEMGVFESKVWLELFGVWLLPLWNAGGLALRKALQVAADALGLRKSIIFRVMSYQIRTALVNAMQSAVLVQAQSVNSWFKIFWEDNFVLPSRTQTEAQNWHKHMLCTLASLVKPPLCSRLAQVHFN